MVSQIQPQQYIQQFPNQISMINQQIPMQRIQNFQIYVGNLEEQITEENLFTHFSQFGAIQAIQIKKDAHTKKSRGFGFITFYSEESAKAAIKQYNHKQIIKNHIRVMWKKKMHEIQPETNLFIKGIDKSITEQDLEDYLKQFGIVFSLMIKYNKEGQSLGYGYASYETKEGAQKAKDASSKQQTQLNGKLIQIQKFDNKNERQQNQNNLYVKNFANLKEDEKMSQEKFQEIQKELESKLQEKFGIFGEISSLAVKYDSNQQKPFAFVCYINPANASQAQKELNDKDIWDNGEKIYVNWFQSKDKRGANTNFKQQANETNIFTKNLKQSVTEQQLKQAFSTFGEITSCKICTPKITTQDKPEQLTQYGFINYKNKDDAKEVITKYRNKDEIKELYENGRAYVNFHIKRQQYQQYKQSKQRQERQDKHYDNRQNSLNPMDFNQFSRNMPPRQQQLMQLQMQQMQQFFQNMYRLANPMNFMLNNPFIGLPGSNFGMQQPQNYQNFASLPQHRNVFPQHNKLPMQQSRQQFRPMNKQIQNKQQKSFNPKNNQIYKNNQNQFIQQQGQPVQQGLQQQGNFQNQQNLPQNNLMMQQQNSQNQKNNIRMQDMLPQQQVLQQQHQVNQPQQSFTVATLRQKLDEFLKQDREKQRLQLGEMIFPMVQKYTASMQNSEQIAPKVTGMLIDFDVFDVQDILEFLEDGSVLEERINEAMELIEQTNTQSSKV